MNKRSQMEVKGHAVGVNNMIGWVDPKPILDQMVEEAKHRQIKYLNLVEATKVLFSMPGRKQ